MDILNIMEKRHSVRSYLDKVIEREKVEALNELILQCNKEGNMNIQLCTNEPQAFSGLMAHYGKFKNVNNYIAIVGKKDDTFDERAGFYGEKVVLKAAELGLNTCWVALTYSKSKVKCTVNKGEKLVCVISLGYGETQGVPRKSKSISELAKVQGELPVWFEKGMKAAQLAPTATNQQKFLISYDGHKVQAKSLGGFYSKIDLGIVKCHFELAAGKDNFMWE